VEVRDEARFVHDVDESRRARPLAPVVLLAVAAMEDAIVEQANLGQRLTPQVHAKAATDGDFLVPSRRGEREQAACQFHTEPLGKRAVLVRLGHGKDPGCIAQGADGGHLGPCGRRELELLEPTRRHDSITVEQDDVVIGPRRANALVDRHDVPVVLRILHQLHRGPTAGKGVAQDWYRRIRAVIVHEHDLFVRV
jgi:hypothetical protein